MTMWYQIPPMLKLQPDEEIERMKAVCRAQQVRFARGPEKELHDAKKMLGLISQEQRRRAENALVVKAATQ